MWTGIQGSIRRARRGMRDVNDRRRVALTAIKRGLSLFWLGGDACIACGMASKDMGVIGAAAGGMGALEKLVAGLPADLPAAVFVVWHLSPGVRTGGSGERRGGEEGRCRGAACH